MLNGRVTPGREAVVSIVVLGSGERRATIEAAIDTGFNGYLTLPRPLVSRLALPFAGSSLATFADARTASLDLYYASVEWHDGPREVLVVQTEGTPLLGMATLEGSHLALDIVAGGQVTIQAL